MDLALGRGRSEAICHAIKSPIERRRSVPKAAARHATVRFIAPRCPLSTERHRPTGRRQIESPPGSR